MSRTLPFKSSFTRVFNSLGTMDVCTDNGKSGTAYLKFKKFICIRLDIMINKIVANCTKHEHSVISVTTV